MLGELLARDDDPTGSRAELDDALDIVTELEGRVLRADELLTRSRREMLAESDWRELAALVSSNRLQASAANDWLRALLERFELEGRLDSPAGSALRVLRERAADAERHLLSNDMRWDDAVRRVEARLPLVHGSTVVVHSRVVEGTALGAHFAQGYPAEQGATRQVASRYSHVKELALTTLVGANGNKLFSGLRHALFHAGELDGQCVQALGDEDLRALIDAFMVDAELAGQARAQCTQRLFDGIRSFDAVASGSAQAIAHKSGRSMALETAAAALVANPEKFQRALGGETVDLNLHCVSLLDRDDIMLWIGQASAFDRLVRSSPVLLRVCDIDGAPRPVRVNVEVRQLAVWVDGERRQVFGRPREAVHRLLGPAVTEVPGGAVRTRIEAMLSRARALSNDIGSLGSGYVESCNKLGIGHPRSVALLARQSGLLDEQELLKLNARSLDEAARELKRIWAAHNGWPCGAAAFEQVLPRLVLLGQWMGETPVMSCRAGSFRARQLDREVKFLATATNSLYGHLPRLDLNSEGWERARRGFTPQ